MKKLFYVALPVFLSLLIFLFSFFNKEVVTVSNSNTTPDNLPVIIIDAGHGGFDGGAVTEDGIPEKDINLNISKYLDEYLSVFGFKTILTREKDESLEDDGFDSIRAKKTSDIHNRMKIMEETDNSIFVSVHQNKFSVEKYSGTQVFYSPQHKDKSSLLAQYIQESVVYTLQPDNTRQIKECGTSVYLMYNAVKPAVLVECGFLSNYEEAEKLKTEEYQKKIAFCIALGIQNYITARTEK